MVSQLASGTVPEDAVVEYEFNGGIKYAGYALTPDHMIVVVTADKDEIVKPVNQMIWFMSITAGIYETATPSAPSGTAQSELFNGSWGLLKSSGSSSNASDAEANQEMAEMLRRKKKRKRGMRL